MFTYTYIGGDSPVEEIGTEASRRGSKKGASGSAIREAVSTSSTASTCEQSHSFQLWRRENASSQLKNNYFADM